MVTGSHIPFDRNGIKFYRPDGELSKADEAPILASSRDRVGYRLLKRCPRLMKRRQTSGPTGSSQLFRTFSKAGALDITNTAQPVATWFRHILTALGADVVQLGRSDTFVPVDTEAVSAGDRAQAQDWTRNTVFDALRHDRRRRGPAVTGR